MEPDTAEPTIDFDTEKIDYMDLVVKQKNDEMMDKLLVMRDINNLAPGEYKFIEDNIQIISLSRDVDFADAQKKIYKQIKDMVGDIQPADDDLEIPTEIPPEEQGPAAPGKEDMPPEPVSPEQMNTPVPPQAGLQGGPMPQQTTSFNPLAKGLTTLNENNLGEMSGVEIFSIVSEELERFEAVKEALIKLPAFYAMKADLFRKIICSLTNGVQIGSGGQLEDIFIPVAENGIGIKLSTRCYTDFGNIEIGKWMVQFNDPEKYLAEEELEKLNNTGSPEEKEVLRKRVVVESIAHKFKDKIYIVLIVNPNVGTRREIAFNFSELIRDGWKNGYISVEFKASVNKGDAGIQIDGELVDLQDIVLDFVRENPDELDEEGLPVKEHIEFINHKHGKLYISITNEDFSDFASNAQSGLFTNEKNFDQGPDQLLTIQRCIPDIKEILLKKC